MFIRGLFENVTEGEKNDAIESIIQHATPRQDFFVMMTLAVSMAVFAILLNSIVILIGSMLIAPLLYPILSLGLGIITSDTNLIGRSVYTIIKSISIALFAGFLIGFLFSSGNLAVFPADIIAGAPSSLMYAVVAAIAGFAAALAITKPHLNDTLPGVAISVALVPPLAVMGVGLARFDWALISNALLLFIANIIGILFSSMIVFSMLRFAVKTKITQEAVKREEKIVMKEARAIETKNNDT
jgi:uncharacterized hydrophobic protein (TIGR00271 family)